MSGGYLTATSPDFSGVSETQGIVGGMDAYNAQFSPLASASSSLVSQSANGLTTYTVNPDGTWSLASYNPDPTVSSFQGSNGFWVNYVTLGNDASGGTMSTATDHGMFVGAGTGSMGDGGGYDEESNSTRAPDYINLNIALGDIVGWNLSISLDRYGHLYFSPFGGGIGKSTTIASASLTVNWIQQGSTPDEEDLNNFLTGNSLNYTAGFWGGFSTTYSPDTHQTATGYGFATPQIGASYNYQPSNMIMNTILKW